MEELYFDYEENFASMLDDMDMEFDDEFWDAYDPEQEQENKQHNMSKGR